MLGTGSQPKMLSVWTTQQQKLTISQKKKLIEGLSEIDYRLKNSMGEIDIQIYALAAIFLGLGTILDKKSTPRSLPSSP